MNMQDEISGIETEKTKKALKSRRTLFATLTVVSGLIPQAGWHDWRIINELPVLAIVGFLLSFAMAYRWRATNRILKMDTEGYSERPVFVLYLETLLIAAALIIGFPPSTGNDFPLTIGTEHKLIAIIWNLNFFGMLSAILSIVVGTIPTFLYIVLEMLFETGLLKRNLILEFANEYAQFVKGFFTKPFKQRSALGRAYEVSLIVFGILLTLAFMTKN